MLDGELALSAGDRELRAEAGTWAQVPPGVPHSLSLPAEPVRYLNLHTPGCGYGAFLRGRADFDQEPANLRRAGGDPLV